MAAKVYRSSLRANLRRNLLNKVDVLLDKIGLTAALGPKTLTAVKLHFGEAGNTSFVRPVFVRQVVQAILKTGAPAFVTDTSTLYRGSRGDAVTHLQTAAHHGFTEATLGAPVLIADGLRARAGEMVPIKGLLHDSVPIADAIARADALVSVAHFKLHEATGFGGALKNIGMGSGTREGKLMMHSSVSPSVNADECVGDGICVRACTFEAISLVDRKARIDKNKCTGCAECLGVCPENAIGIAWNQALDVLAKTMVEFAAGAMAGKQGRCFFVNFATQISPACDCYGMNDAPITNDLGIFASTDPVAVDQACVDALQRAAGVPGTALKKAFAPGEDKIKDIYPKVPYLAQLEHAEELGLGERAYELIEIG